MSQPPFQSGLFSGWQSLDDIGSHMDREVQGQTVGGSARNALGLLGP